MLASIFCAISERQKSLRNSGLPRVWYGQTNFTVGIRRDLRERWKSLVADELGWSEVPTLRLAEIAGDVVLMKKSDFYKDVE